MEDKPTLHRYPGRILVIVIFSVIFLGTYAVTWLSVNHPKAKEYKRGNLVPVVTCPRVLDAESIVAERDGKQTTVRFLGIESPVRRPERLPAGLDPAEETDTAYQILITWLRKKRIMIHPPGDEEQRDEAGRLLAYVDIYGVDVGRKMLREGQAFASDVPHPRLEEYKGYEDEARDAGKGIWRTLTK